MLVSFDVEQAEADRQLRSRAGVARSFHHRLETAVEDSRYPVGLGEQRRVAQRQRQSQSGAHQRARRQRRLRDQHERHRVSSLPIFVLLTFVLLTFDLLTFDLPIFVRPIFVGKSRTVLNGTSESRVGTVLHAEN